MSDQIVNASRGSGYSGRAKRNRQKLLDRMSELQEKDGSLSFAELAKAAEAELMREGAIEL
jgi:hypothetical protein